MAPTHEIELAQQIIQNDPDKAAPLLKLLDAFQNSRGDPLAEAMTRDVMLFLYSKTEHCEEAMRGFIAETIVDSHHLVASVCGAFLVPLFVALV